MPDPSEPLPRPKLSIFDETLPGTLPPPVAPPPLPEASHPAGLKPPKTSVFDLTLPGVAPKPEGFLARFRHRDAVQVPLAPSEEPLMYHPPQPETHDPEAPTVPQAVLERTLQDVLSEVDIEALEHPESSLEITDPGVTPLRAEPESPQVQKAAHPPLPPEDDPFDEGTAAEWNPKWNSTPGILTPLPQAAPPIAKVPSPARPSRLWPWVGGLTLGAASVTLAVLLLGRQGADPHQPSIAPVPPALQAFVARAEAGDVTAMRQLGLRFAYGVDAPMDRTQALAWLEKAAKAGSEVAQQELRALGASYPSRMTEK